MKQARETSCKAGDNQTDQDTKDQALEELVTWDTLIKHSFETIISPDIGTDSYFPPNPGEVLLRHWTKTQIEGLSAKLTAFPVVCLYTNLEK